MGCSYMQAQITKLYHRMHKEQSEHSIIWCEVNRDIATFCNMVARKPGVKLSVVTFIQYFKEAVYP